MNAMIQTSLTIYYKVFCYFIRIHVSMFEKDRSLFVLIFEPFVFCQYVSYVNFFHFKIVITSSFTMAFG